MFHCSIQFCEGQSIFLPPGQRLHPLHDSFKAIRGLFQLMVPIRVHKHTHATLISQSHIQTFDNSPIFACLLTLFSCFPSSPQILSLPDWNILTWLPFYAIIPLCFPLTHTLSLCCVYWKASHASDQICPAGLLVTCLPAIQYWNQFSDWAIGPSGEVGRRRRSESNREERKRLVSFSKNHRKCRVLVITFSWFNRKTDFFRPVLMS